MADLRTLHSFPRLVTQDINPMQSGGIKTGSRRFKNAKLKTAWHRSGFDIRAWRQVELAGRRRVSERRLPLLLPFKSVGE